MATKNHHDNAPGPTAPTQQHDQGIVRAERGEEQPRDEDRARRVSRVDHGDDPPGHQPGRKV